MSSHVRTDEAAELNGLLDAMPAAVTCATSLLRQLSIHAPAYVAAEAKISKMLTRINELMNGRHDAPAGSAQGLTEDAWK
jgi:hypothetical protein